MDITKKFHNFFDARNAFTQIFRADVDLVMHGGIKNKLSRGRSTLPSNFCIAHDLSAYLQEILDAFNEIAYMMRDFSLDVYRSRVAAKSSVERGFFIIGEALRGISGVDE